MTDIFNLVTTLSSDGTSTNLRVIEGVSNSTSTIATGGGSPGDVAVNPVTNTIYVVTVAYPYWYSSAVTVIDGTTNSITATVDVGHGHGEGEGNIAVNPVTNKIYVKKYNTVMVIDGATNTVEATVATGVYSLGMVVNPVTNKIYVSNFDSNDVTVIDGATNTTTTVAAGSGPRGIAVNSVTNKIYVANSNSHNVTVIDGATNTTTTVEVGLNPAVLLGVNPVTNKIYVPNAGSHTVTVIDGATNSTSTIVDSSSFYRPRSIVVNPITNRAYVANFGTNTVSVIGELNTDTTPPIISSSQTPVANINGWNNSNVTVSFTATDDVSIPTCTVNSATLTTEDAGQSVSTTCTDAAGNSASATVSNINIDKTAPMLSMASLLSNYTVGSSVVLAFSASDTLSSLASASATLNGNPVSSGSSVVLSHLGSNTFTLSATDRAGNTTTQTKIFTVTYGFGGFLPPLTADSRTTFRLGSVIPVKFDLYDANGAAISTAVARLSLQQFSGDEPVGAPIDATPTSGADSGNLFRYNGGHYMYNLSTKPFTAGTWRIQATLDDGSVRTIEIGLTSK